MYVSFSNLLARKKIDINPKKAHTAKYMYIKPKNEQQKAIATFTKNNKNNLKNVELKNLVKLFTFPPPR